MSYELDFHPVAWKEWQSLDSTIREQFKQKLEVRDNELIVIVVSVGKRERNIVYKNAAQR